MSQTAESATAVYGALADRLNHAWRVLRHVAPGSLPARDDTGPVGEGMDGSLADACLDAAGILRTLHRGRVHPIRAGESMDDAHRHDYEEIDEHRKLALALNLWLETPAGERPSAGHAQAQQLLAHLDVRSAAIVRRWD